MRPYNSLLLVFFAIITSSITACTPSQQTRQPDTLEAISKDPCLTLMTYNIRVGAGREKLLMPVKYLNSSGEKLEKIAAAIKSVDPDIISLQEVKGPVQAKYLADALGFNYVYVSHGDSRLEWGLAVLSRFTITEYHREVLHHDNKKPRVALVCTIDLPDSFIAVVNVHYALGDYDKQVKETMKILGNISGPTLLMGDLNLIDPQEGLAPMRAELIDTCEAVDSKGSREAKQRGTFRFGSKRIDYIFVDPEYFTVLDVGLTAEEHRKASDHLAYFACVTLKNRTK
ncbi:MAG: endonuclease/exonuclease/phosphatase family protein [Deltaproteobacteria bacterium]|nr:endonuclease/exonuclease/phosphatase family protein [Deltaproteobacteria bacterium]